MESVYIVNPIQKIEMRILHISDAGLPDQRVERMAITMKDEGHELVFLGGREIKYQNLSAFTETRMVPLGNGPQISLDSRVKKRWIKAIDQMKPDIIHAHNVIVGHFLLDTDYPVVFDDHENLSQQRSVFMSRSFIRRNMARLLLHYIPKWEVEMAKKYPILTVSEGTTTIYKEHSTRIGVVNNIPLLREVEWLENNPNRQGMVFAGGDFSRPKFIPMRNMTGLRDILDFDIVNNLPHREMMQKLTNYKIGLMPYLPHPFHHVASPNKPYEYLHAGLQIIFNPNYSHLFGNNPYVHLFNDFTDIKDVANSVPDVDSLEIMKHARENYIWEKSEEAVKTAYKQA